MKISTKGRYATRALLYLAENYGKKPVPLSAISKDQEISVKYLENILRMLVIQKLVISTKGKNGGFVLAKRPEEIKLSDIIVSAEGSTDPVFCVSDPKLCGRSKQCAARDVWTELNLRILQFLGSITLEDLVQRQRAKLELLSGMAGRNKEKHAGEKSR